MTTPRILMCPPDYYGIEYEINPWMSRSRPSNHAEATAQWQQLRAMLSSAGAEIAQLAPVPGLPDMVFTANAALIYGRRAVLAHFRHEQRQGEEPHFAHWLTEQGFEVTRVPEELFFEGAGDALFCGETLLAGYRMRSDARCHQQIGEMLGVRVLPLELVDPYYYHLDTCFCPLTTDTAIYYPAAFDEYALKALADAVPTLLPVETSEARRFACNAVVVGRRVTTNTGCDALHDSLRAHGFEPSATPLDEFTKAGGSAKCLTLRLDGEDGAAWRAKL